MEEPMSEDNAAQTNEPNEKAEQNSGYTPPATQDELNRIIDDRLKRERQKFADYGDLKAKAAKFDEFEEANKSELDKATAKAADLERERDAARVEMLRFKIAAKHGISDDDADMFLTGTDEEALSKQAERLAAHYADAGKPRAPKPDANQGRSGDAGPKSTADSFAEFFRTNI